MASNGFKRKFSWKTETESKEEYGDDETLPDLVEPSQIQINVRSKADSPAAQNRSYTLDPGIYRVHLISKHVS